MNTRQGHVIIAGFGIGGRFVAECLNRHAIPYVIVEVNADTVRTQRNLGLTIVHGDTSDEPILRSAGIDRARALIVAVSDDKAVVKATETARRIRPDLHIIVSTQYTAAGLLATEHGADETIVAEQLVANELHRRVARLLDGARESGSQE